MPPPILLRVQSATYNGSKTLHPCGKIRFRGNSVPVGAGVVLGWVGAFMAARVALVPGILREKSIYNDVTLRRG